MSCRVCGAQSIDRHHIISKGAGGSDNVVNIIHLCRKHHSECHSIGRETFFSKYRITRILEIAKKHKIGEI